MGIRYWALGLLALWGSFGVAQAAPLLMFFTPGSTTVTVGDSFVVDFAITGLNPALQSDIISAFDVDVVFDPTLLSITGISFGTQLGVGADQFSGSSIASGVADLYQFSLLSDADLKLQQPGATVTLGSLNFIALAAGISALDFDTLLQTVGGALDSNAIATLLTPDTQSGSVTIHAGQATSVPEPTTLLLLGIGLIFLASHRQRRYHPYTGDSKNSPWERPL